MEIAHLELLRELADRGSVTEVARATGRTTSAVSQQLQLLQRTVGVQLLERSGRGVRLTDAGQALARTAVKVSTAIAEAEADWDRYRQTATGTVRLAFFFSAGEILIPGLLDRMDAYPQLELITEERDVGEDEFDALVSDFDIVIAHRSEGGRAADRSRLQVTQLLREPLDVGVALDHRLAGRDRVTTADVIDEPWIGVPEDFPLDRMLSAISVQAGRDAKIIFRTTHLPLAEKLVEAGRGVALLPRHSSQPRAAGHLALLPLAGIRAGRQLEALSRPDRAARRSVRLVLDALTAEAATRAATGRSR